MSRASTHRRKGQVCSWQKISTSPAAAQAVRSSGGFRAKKSLGQNFLDDTTLQQSIAVAARLQPGDRVLEIGPGTGSLTTQLLQTGAAVLAVEKDARLVERLNAAFGQRQDFRLVEGDFLTMNLSEMIQLHPQEGSGRILVAGNLPYYITTETIRKLLPLGNAFSALHFVIQDDAAKRLVSPDSSDVRAVNVEIDFFSQPQYLFKIEKEKFSPVPTVDGALVRFELKEPSQYLLQEPNQFMKMVHHAYLQRRKMLRKSLEGLYGRDHLERAQERLKAVVDLTARPQEVPTADLIAIFQALQQTKQCPES